jgi:hypothetical protein
LEEKESFVVLDRRTETVLKGRETLPLDGAGSTAS